MLYNGKLCYEYYDFNTSKSKGYKFMYILHEPVYVYGTEIASWLCETDLFLHVLDICVVVVLRVRKKTIKKRCIFFNVVPLSQWNYGDTIWGMLKK